jgi:hypothetical protein
LAHQSGPWGSPPPEFTVQAAKAWITAYDTEAVRARSTYKYGLPTTVRTVVNSVLIACGAELTSHVLFDKRDSKLLTDSRANSVRKL